MKDILAELRVDYSDLAKDNYPYEVINDYEKERHEAADEIERLREALKPFVAIGDYLEKYEPLKDSNDEMKVMVFDIRRAWATVNIDRSALQQKDSE